MLPFFRLHCRSHPTVAASAVAAVLLPPLLLSAYRFRQVKLAPPPSLLLPYFHCFCCCFCRLAVLPSRHCRQYKLTPPPSLLLSLPSPCHHLVDTACQFRAAAAAVLSPPLRLRLKSTSYIYVKKCAPPSLLPSSCCCHYCISISPLPPSQAHVSAVTAAFGILFPLCKYHLCP